MKASLIVNKIHQWTMPYASPHYYYGRSVMRLALMNFLNFVFNYCLVTPPRRNNLSALRSMKDSCLGKRALVLGNGPSIDLLRHENIEGYVDGIFAVNHFYRSNAASLVVPNYYVLSDPKSFEDTEISMGSAFIRYLQENRVQLFVPYKVKNQTFEQSAIPTASYDDRQRFLFNRNSSPVKPRNFASVTLYKAINIALYLGYSEIYVLGLDNTESRLSAPPSPVHTVGLLRVLTKFAGS
jgi:hypothetical protein